MKLLVIKAIDMDGKNFAIGNTMYNVKSPYLDAWYRLFMVICFFWHKVQAKFGKNLRQIDLHFLHLMKFMFSQGKVCCYFE